MTASHVNSAVLQNESWFSWQLLGKSVALNSIEEGTLLSLSKDKTKLVVKSLRGYFCVSSENEQHCFPVIHCWLCSEHIAVKFYFCCRLLHNWKLRGEKGCGDEKMGWEWKGVAGTPQGMQRWKGKMEWREKRQTEVKAERRGNCALIINEWTITGCLCSLFAV